MFWHKLNSCYQPPCWLCQLPPYKGGREGDILTTSAPILTKGGGWEVLTTSVPTITKWGEREYWLQQLHPYHWGKRGDILHPPPDKFLFHPPMIRPLHPPPYEGGRGGYVSFILTGGVRGVCQLHLTKWGGVGTLIWLATITNWGNKGILTMLVSFHKGGGDEY